MRTPEEEAAAGAFRLAMGRLAQGVCVVATTAGGHDHALTANTVTSVSLDPLLLLVCVETDARFHDAVREAGVFGVSVLAADQRAAADWFATPGRPLPGQLDRVAHHRGDLGVPLLDDALATFECAVRDIHPAGDHSIVVAEVRVSALGRSTRPALVHFRGAYSALT
ncbi:flavin reductase (DIM6/NTAB) family NADH-FMN oxidoreductase RutF [Knoellia remsis]|uniref:Flavin reductase (DIM6/NTAB) family NADH-FMN oxidoreductase RutF n=1 Tax=Knoellia remsis TaxID=407159 RepID=A0A2T0UQQ7_9MICO|nr:flavin reductase family protein [Knoellia remsis]PRY60265.1 flavin reductase (DIM6/NTAB) family NADH-FMN oxidoreductase RutF [Knoellia remsis]